MKIINELIQNALQSELKQKHSCIALLNGKPITPIFYNYKRNSLLGRQCCSAHSEMCVINYLLNSLWYEKGILQCLL